jgi:hypothetical protein
MEDVEDDTDAVLPGPEDEVVEEEEDDAEEGLPGFETRPGLSRPATRSKLGSLSIPRPLSSDKELDTKDSDSVLGPTTLWPFRVSFATETVVPDPKSSS